MFEPITLPSGAKMLFNTVKLDATRSADERYVIATCWRNFEALAKMCSETKELGYEMLWQGVPEGQG